MKQNNALKSTAAALVMLFAAANENNAQGNKPGGFEPVAPAKTEVNTDSVAAVKSDTLKSVFFSSLLGVVVAFTALFVALLAALLFWVVVTSFAPPLLFLGVVIVL